MAETPKYILNGVESYRWIKSITTNDFMSSGGVDYTCTSASCSAGYCSTNYCSVGGCPTVIRPFYALTDDGEVYLTTANGVIYYLANDESEMRQIYPINKAFVTTPDGLAVNSAGLDVTPGVGLSLIHI